MMEKKFKKNLIMWSDQPLNTVGLGKDKNGGVTVIKGEDGVPFGVFALLALNPSKDDETSKTSFYSFFIKTSVAQKLKREKNIDFKKGGSFGWVLIKIKEDNKIEILDFEPTIKGSKHPNKRIKSDNNAGSSYPKQEQKKNDYLDDVDQEETKKPVPDIEEDDLPF